MTTYTLLPPSSFLAGRPVAFPCGIVPSVHRTLPVAMRRTLARGEHRRTMADSLPLSPLGRLAPKPERRPGADRSAPMVAARRGAMATAEGAAFVRCLAGRAIDGDATLAAEAIRTMAPCIDTLIRQTVASIGRARWKDADGCWHNSPPDACSTVASGTVVLVWETVAIRGQTIADLPRYLRSAARGIARNQDKAGRPIGPVEGRGKIGTGPTDDGKELARRKADVATVTTHRLRSMLAERIREDSALLSLATELANDESSSQSDSLRQRLHRARARLAPTH